jgi:cytochrome P450
LTSARSGCTPHGQQLRDEIISVLFAGYETTVVTALDARPLIATAWFANR